MSMEEHVITELAAGKVQGCKSTLPNGESYYFYKGIPYAKPPVGELRFRPPEPLDTFDEDVLDCSYERSSCPSYIHFPPTISVSEDCLYANIYTPVDPVGAQNNGPLPVMVWIHGGGFIAGNGDAAVYDPRCLLQEGVIVVTFNYRLGPFGFLFFPEKNIYGNMGLKDQRLLLKWVHDNISKFGGDPRNVTIFGESAGASSCHLQYLSESSRQYFHRAICQSGSAFTVWTEQMEAVSKTKFLANLVGCIGEGSDQVYESLMNASALDLLVGSEKCVTSQDTAVFRIFAFTPVVEPKESVEPFLTENYVDIITKPNMTDIPLMLGVTSNEAICFIQYLSIDQYAKDTKMFVPPQLVIAEDKLTSVGEEIKQFYFGDRAVSQENLQSLLNFVSDCMFVIPVCVASELQSRYQHSAQQYFYLFSFVGGMNYVKNMFQMGISLDGASHGDDITYLFEGNFFNTENVDVSSKEYQFRESMCRLWTNFAKHGNPTPDKNQFGISWKPVDNIDPCQKDFTLNVMDLSDTLNMVGHPFRERADFWKKLFEDNCGIYLKHRAVR